MKKDKFLLRLIASPFVLMVILISFNYEVFKRLWMFIKYGGEWMSYQKDDQKTMSELFAKMKSNHVNN